MAPRAGLRLRPLRAADEAAAEAAHVTLAAEHRRRGCATEMLRQALVVARALGVDDVLVTCAVNNTASARVIEACGGERTDVVAQPDGELLARYWIR